MELYSRHLGSGEPVIILHGLYGSGDNWYSIGRELAKRFSVFLMDQRNHGHSPHHEMLNYQVLSDDLQKFMNAHRLNQAVLLGHSMGGKTAMTFGLQHPERIHKMIVVDISPLSYGIRAESPEFEGHRRIIEALQSIDHEHLTRREEADQQLAKSISSPAIRQFLLKNLKRTPEGKFIWMLNIQSLADNLSLLSEGIIHEDETDPRGIPQFPLLFIKGARSGYIGPHDEEAIRHYFPWAGIVEIPGTGHWVHADQPDAFLTIVRQFLAEH